MNLNRERKGEAFVFSQVIFWALFPIITIISYNKLTPLVSLAVSMSLSTIVFAVLLTLRKKWQDLKSTTALKDILLTTLILGIIYYLLFFFGLRSTSAGNAGIISLTEIFFSYLFFQVWRKDYLPGTHKIGAILMAVGALIILYPNMQGFKGGEFLILTAALIAPVGNFFQQRARKSVSSESIMFIRSLISASVIILLALTLKEPFSYPSLRDSWVALLINGVFLFGISKILWIEGIHRISVTKANALGSISPLFTLIFAWILLQNQPTILQLLSLIPMSLGVILLGINKKNN